MKGPYVSYHSSLGLIRERVRVLAWTSVTSQVVGCVISWQQGDIVILPPPDDMFSALLFLKDRGVELYKENVESLGEDIEAPKWIQNYRSSENQRLEDEGNRLATELQTVGKN